LNDRRLRTAAGLHGLRACPAVSGVVFGIFVFLDPVRINAPAAHLLVEGLGVGGGGRDVGVTGSLVGAGGELELVGRLQVGIAGGAVGGGVVLEVEEKGEHCDRVASGSARLLWGESPELAKIGNFLDTSFLVGTKFQLVPNEFCAWIFPEKAIHRRRKRTTRASKRTLKENDSSRERKWPAPSADFLGGVPF
jgi:hypothetical protein